MQICSREHIMISIHKLLHTWAQASTDLLAPFTDQKPGKYNFYFDSFYNKVIYLAIILDCILLKGMPLPSCNKKYPTATPGFQSKAFPDIMFQLQTYIQPF